MFFDKLTDFWLIIRRFVENELFTYINLYVNICMATRIIQEEYMLIRYSKSFEKGKKELSKKHKVEEFNMLDSIVMLVKRSDTYELMKSSPLAYLYGFEELKEDKSGFFSFRLSKKRSSIRLIGRYQDNIVTVQLVYISMDHYKDFNPKGVILDDE